MASGLGKCLRRLIHNPGASLFVSSADRIARRADIFVLIQEQGLGQRIYDVSTGLCLDDIVHAGGHHAIQRQTEVNRASRQAGVKRYQAAGGIMGSKDIGEQSREGATTKKRLADDRKTKVLSVVSRLSYQGRGQRPSLGTVSDELDRLEVRTGQGKFFNPKRLSQFAKAFQDEWEHAFDCYARNRRRIRQVISSTLVEFRNRRKRQAAMRRLFRRTPLHLVRASRGVDMWFSTPHLQHLRVYHTSKRNCQDGCRGPPLLVIMIP